MPFIKSTGTASTQISAKYYLAELRSNSCYGTLRSVIDFVFYLAFGVHALVAVAAVMTIAKIRTPEILALGLVGGGWLLSLIFTIAARQAAHVLIDISDTLLEAHRPIANSGAATSSVRYEMPR